MRTLFAILSVLVLTAAAGLAGCVGGLPSANPPRYGNVPNGASPIQSFNSAADPKFALPDNMAGDAGDIADP